MIGRLGLMAALALCAVDFAAPADAQDAQGTQATPAPQAAQGKPKHREKDKGITVEGCVLLQPPGCKRLNGYIVNSGVPELPADTYIRATGHPSEYSGACFGPRLINIKWKATKGACGGPMVLPPPD